MSDFRQPFRSAISYSNRIAQRHVFCQVDRAGYAPQSLSPDTAGSSRDGVILMLAAEFRVRKGGRIDGVGGGDGDKPPSEVGDASRRTAINSAFRRRNAVIISSQSARASASDQLRILLHAESGGAS